MDDCAYPSPTHHLPTCPPCVNSPPSPHTLPTTPPPQFFCGMASVTSNSRMLYAFSRDGAVPGSKLWHSIHPRTKAGGALCVCVV